MKPLITVLIPVYNREKYIRQCLDSVCGQTYHNLEIICLDNASTDDSLAILKEYAKQDPRVRVIAKPVNTGYGSSINLGISNANGEYIGIIESDDWAEKNMFEDLAELAVQYPQADIIRGDFYCYKPSLNLDNPKKSIPKKLANRLLKPVEDKDIFKLERAIWSGIYRRSFLQKNNIVLHDEENLTFQDTSFTIITWALAEYVYLSDKPLVHYRQDNASSSVHQATHVFDIQKDFAYASKFLAERALPFQAQINHLKLQCYWWNMKRLPLEASCAFAVNCTAEICSLVKDGPMDWSGIPLRVRLRTYLWILNPRLFLWFWKKYKGK